MSTLQAMFLGLLQGMTEFLPVSSSGHLAIAQHYLPGFRQPGVLFDVMLHIGTMVAVVIYFRRDIFLILASPFRQGEESRIYRHLLKLIVLGSIPTAVIGILFKDFFTGLFHNPTAVSFMLLVTGCLLYVSERARSDGRRGPEMTVSDALFVGVAQGCAIVPGISRSGATIATLLLKGVEGETAARFSFLLALPAVFGAALLSTPDIPAVLPGEIPAYIAGTGTAFAAGLWSIHFLLKIIRKKRLFAFAFYCWLAGGAFLYFSL